MASDIFDRAAKALGYEDHYDVGFDASLAAAERIVALADAKDAAERRCAELEAVVRESRPLTAAHADALANGTAALDALVREAEQRGAERALSEWSDAPDEWTPAVAEAHPTRSGSHAQFATAMRMVGSRRSKAALVALVNWLLLERRNGLDELPSPRKPHGDAAVPPPPPVVWSEPDHEGIIRAHRAHTDGGSLEAWDTGPCRATDAHLRFRWQSTSRGFAPTLEEAKRAAEDAHRRKP